MLISLGMVPMVPLGMQNRLTCFSLPLCHRRYICSENSCAPPPVPRIIPILRFSSMDMEARSRRESLTASVVAARHNGTTRETCLRSRASTQASSSNSGISPPMWTRRWEESNRVIFFTPDFPASTARQKASLPIPFGLTAPIPVMTMRGSMFGALGFNLQVVVTWVLKPDAWRLKPEIIIQMPLGLYISVPFCRSKCTYCNFASDVFSRTLFEKYVTRVSDEISSAEQTSEQMGGLFERTVDSIYVGGGTPTVLDVTQLERVFVTIRQTFDVQPDAEITVECAPGTLSDEMLAALLRCGVKRVSLGVQSFVDREAASVARLHTRNLVLADIQRLRAAGISNINVDLIAGLPHQNRSSWEYSLNEL